MTKLVAVQSCVGVWSWISIGIRQVVTVALIALTATPAFAANYPLELVTPRAAGTSPAAGMPAIESRHRIFKAYPGLTYEIRAAVIGGAYPYRFSLSNAPFGMTVDSNTGVVTWPNPQETATPQLSVVDSEGATVSSSWTITVTRSGFHFIDSINGRAAPDGTGSLERPWRTISDMINSPTAVAGNIVYFRAGTYDALDLTRSGVGGNWERVEFNSGTKPLVWVAFPGEAPLIDFGFRPGVEPGVIFRMNGNNVYMDGFETRNSRIIGFQMAHGSYNTLRRLRMRDHNIIGADLGGTNSAYIMTLTGFQTTYGHYLGIQDCEFFNAPMDMGIKTYSQRKILIEDNEFHDLFRGTELKADMPQFTYRHNVHLNISEKSIGGNMHVSTTSGEILFNYARHPTGSLVMDVNQDGMAGRIDVYRNTFVGRVRVNPTDSADGPFVFSRNVIVNDDAGTTSNPHIYLYNVTAPDRVVSTENLTGYPRDNVVDVAGKLTGSYSQYLGTRGYELDDHGSVPRPPGDLSVQ